MASRRVRELRKVVEAIAADNLSGAAAELEGILWRLGQLHPDDRRGREQLQARLDDAVGAAGERLADLLELAGLDDEELCRRWQRATANAESKTNGRANHAKVRAAEDGGDDA